MVTSIPTAIVQPPRCLICGGALWPWRDRKREQGFGQCRQCGQVRPLNPDQYGKAVLVDLQSGAYSPLENLDRRYRRPIIGR